MGMATTNRPILVLLHLLLLGFLSLTAISAQSPSPSPAPASSPDSSDSGSPSSSPSPAALFFDSPPAPSPSDLTTAPAPAPVPAPFSELGPSPTPAAAPVSSAFAAEVADDEQVAVGDDGMSGGKKAGIALGLVTAFCVVGFGGMIYRKRQENIRRARYRYVAGTELLGRNAGP